MAPLHGFGRRFDPYSWYYALDSEMATQLHDVVYRKCNEEYVNDEAAAVV